MGPRLQGCVHHHIPFSREAHDYAASVSPRAVLIGGRQLTDLMITHGVGVTVRQRYELKRIDADYFEEDTP